MLVVRKNPWSTVDLCHIIYEVHEIIYYDQEFICLARVPSESFETIYILGEVRQTTYLTSIRYLYRWKGYPQSCVYEP